MLRIILVLLLLAATVPAQSTLLADDFNDNQLNGQLWQTLACNSGSFITETNQRIEMLGRMHLGTASGFDPIALGGLRIRCTLVMNASGPSGDVFRMISRGTFDSPGPYCETVTGVRAGIWHNGTMSLYGMGALSGGTEGQGSVGQPGDLLHLELLDLGRSATFTVHNQTSGLRQSISTRIIGSTTSGVVEFYNRESPFLHAAYLDNVEIVALGGTASYTTYRQSCPSSVGVPALTAANPVYGQSWTLTVNNLAPSTAGNLIFSLNDRRFGLVDLPMDLTPFGGDGCFMNVSLGDGSGAISQFVPSGPTGVARVSFPIPSDPAVLGFAFFNQYVSLDRPPGRPLRITTTNAGRGVVGI